MGLPATEGFELLGSRQAEVLGISRKAQAERFFQPADFPGRAAAACLGDALQQLDKFFGVLEGDGAYFSSGGADDAVFVTTEMAGGDGRS